MGAAKIPVRDQNGVEIGEVLEWTFDETSQSIQVVCEVDDVKMTSMKIPVKEAW